MTAPFQIHRTIFFAILLCALSACASTHYRNATTVDIANGVSMHLLLPDNTLSSTQQITGTYRNSTHTMLVRVEATPTSIIFIGLTPTGTQLFNIQFDGNTLSSWQSPLFNAPFDARYVLADYEMTTLPLSQLKTALPNTVQLQETVTKNTPPEKVVRELRHQQGSLILRAEYQGNTVHYCHQERHYCLQITNLE